MTVKMVRVGEGLVTTKEFLAEGHNFCTGCGESLAIRMALKALGENVIVANATGCAEVCTTPMPYTSWRIPWIHTLFENVAAVISGVEAGLKISVEKGRLQERDIKCVAMGGDGATSDIGIQALSGAFERGHNFLYICLDNEAYMNTGIQRSSATPYGASTTTAPAGKFSIGQVTRKKNMPAIAAAHNIPYVATACPSYRLDLMKKVRKGAEIEGPAYLHILVPCPTGWRHGGDVTVEIGQLAVQTGIFPLYEIEHGRYTLNADPPKLKPIEEYLKLQGRYRHLTGEEIGKIQEMVNADYALLKEKVEAFPG